MKISLNALFLRINALVKKAHETCLSEERGPAFWRGGPACSGNQSPKVLSTGRPGCTVYIAYGPQKICTDTISDRDLRHSQWPGSWCFRLHTAHSMRKRYLWKVNPRPKYPPGRAQERYCRNRNSRSQSPILRGTPLPYPLKRLWNPRLRRNRIRESFPCRMPETRKNCRKRQKYLRIRQYRQRCLFLRKSHNPGLSTSLHGRAVETGVFPMPK